MDRQSMLVLGLCASILLAAAIIAYRPWGAAGNLSSPPSGSLSSTSTPPPITGKTAAGTGDQQTKTLSLSGTGTATARADQATLTLGVETESPRASEAVGENTRLMVEVVKAVRGRGVKDDQMETVSYSVNPIYDEKWQRVIGYRVTNMLRIRTTDLAAIGGLIDAAGAAGANRIEGVSFGLSNDLAERLKLEAYRKAIGDVSARARVIAEGLGLKLTGVQSVSESIYYPTSPPVRYEMGAPKISTPIFEGALGVTANVQVVYTFE